MRLLPSLLPLCVLAACSNQVECGRRKEDAARDALRDAAVCRWEPENVLQPECAALDRQPLHTYTSVFCATADLPTCIEAHGAIWFACFAGPDDDTGQDTDSER